MTLDTDNVVAPCTHHDQPALDGDGHDRLERLQDFFRVPGLVSFGLDTVRCEMLLKISPAMKKCDGKQWEARIGGRAQCVPG